MNFIISTVFISATLVCMSSSYISIEETTAYDYHRTTGISTARRLRRIEELNLIYNATGLRTIVGGSNADIAEVPYQVGLVISIMFLLTSVCGGSLISSSRVLTAAHCHYDGFLRAQSFTVVLGSNRLFFGGQRIETTDVSVHPYWNPAKFEYDVAILRIPIVSFTNVIQAVALPVRDDLSQTFMGWTAIASGYGITSDDSSIKRNQRLSSVKLTIISNDECAETYGLDFIHDGNICTSNRRGQSTCRGDSGGPLVVYIDHVRVLIGVTSFGARVGCEAGFPAAYSRVTFFLPWIVNQ